MVFMAVVYIASKVHVAHVKLKWRHEAREAGVGHEQELCDIISNIRSKYYMTIPMMLNLALPSLTASMFATFSCTDTDPSDTVAGDDLYMTTDYSISCTTDRYKFARLWAGFNIFLYCVLLPAFYFYELYVHREDICSRDTLMANGRLDEARKFRIRPVRVLFDVYKPELWYWEIIEMMWKTMMTGVLVLVGRGSARQVVAGIIITVCYAKILDAYEPYAVGHLQSIKHVSVAQVQCILFMALLIRVEVISREAIGVIVICFVILFANVFMEAYLRLLKRSLEVSLQRIYMRWSYSSGNNRSGNNGKHNLDTERADRSISLPVMSPLMLANRTAHPLPLQKEGEDGKTDIERDIKKIISENMTTYKAIQ